MLIVGAAVCAAFLLSSTFTALAAAPTESQSVNLVGDAKTQVDDLNVRAGYVQAEIDTLDDQLETYSESFNEMQLRLTDVNTQMSELRRQLQDAQADHAYRVKKFDDRLIALYKSGGDDGLLTILLGSSGFSDLVNRVRLIATLAGQDQHLVASLNESAKNLGSLLQQIDASKAEELTIRKQIEGQQNQIEATLADRQKTLAGIDSNIAAVIEQERQRQEAEQANLKAMFASLQSGGQDYSGLVSSSGNPVIDQLLQTALFYQGVPYVWAGDRPSTGFDCSGFVAYVFRQHGVSLPHYSGSMAQMGQEIMPENIQPGDVLCFGNPVHHVGIYLGNGYFINAPRTGDVVRIEPLNDRHNLAWIRRFNIQPRTGSPLVS